VVHRRRLQVLQSVDDLVEAYVHELAAANALEDTVLLYTSDHGYHMGQVRKTPSRPRS
jgi:extracellular sulfatase Sulf